MGADSLLESLGYLGIFISVFIECGVPLGLILPLPGWTLLFSAGVLAASDILDVPTILAVGILAAILGYIAGYFTGYKYGRKLFFEKPTKKYFTADQGRKTEKFMQKYGRITLVAGRFLAIVHNLAPILSGVAKTPFLSFMILNVIGAVLWVFSGVFLGFFIGRQVPNAPYYVIPLVIIFMIAINTRPGHRLINKISKRLEVV
jgi:membrane-associated protein